MHDTVIVLRHKAEGQNSIEEIAKRIHESLCVKIVTLPYDSTDIFSIIRNICFIKNIEAKTVHIMCPTEAYILPFVKAKRIITFHDLGTIIASRNIIYRIAKMLFYIFPAMQFSDFITFVSNETLKEFQKLTGCKKSDKLKVIYNFYDSRFSTKKGKYRKQKKFSILHIGTACRKNLEIVIEACKGLNVRLDIVGILSDTQQQLLNRYNVDYKNEYDITTAQIIEKYFSCDIVSFPSSYEGFGMPIIEANAAGKPVIAGDIPALHEIAKASAVYVNPKSVEQIRRAIQKLRNDSIFYNKMSALGLENSKRFSADAIVNKYGKLYTL